MDGKHEIGVQGTAALMAQHWPSVGSRDEAAKDLAGMLLRGGWAEEEVDRFVMLVARIAGDEEWRKRGKAHSTARKLAAGEPVTGGPSLASRLRGDGERVVAQVRKWLELNEGGREQQAGDRHNRSHQFATGVPFEDEVRPWSVRASEIEQTRVRWLWEGRIPLGAITLLDGDPGLGKSLLTIDLAARVSTGREMPDGTPGVDGGVVLLSAEDDLAATVRPRLAVAWADLERVELLRGANVYVTATGQTLQRPLLLPLDIPRLEEMIQQVGARLVVIDPLMAYLDMKVNSWRDQDVRTALAPLASLAERTGAAILILRHLNKATGTSALYRGGGSIGIVAAARSALLVAKHPDDPDHERVLTATKSNLGPPLPSMRYCITASEKDESIPFVEWRGECAVSAEQALAASQAGGDAIHPSKMDEALRWLHAALANGPRLGREVEHAARAAGISDATLRRARGQLGVHIQRRGYGAELYTWWSLDDGESGVGDPRATSDEASGYSSDVASDPARSILLNSSSAAQPEIMSGTDTDEHD
jgi:hypothetical protein